MTTTRDDTRSAIVERAAALLAEQGPAAVTTRGVAAAAGVQAPTIYRLFGDKDGLLDAVAEHVLATAAGAKAVAADEEGAAGTDPVADLRAGWDTYVDFGLANPAVFTLLTDPARASTSAAARSGLDVLARRVHRVARAGLLRVGEERAVELVHAAGTGVVLTLLAVPVERRDRGVADDLRDAVLARVLRERPGPVASGSVPAAVTLRAHVPDLTALSPTERALLREWLDRVAAG